MLQHHRDAPQKVIPGVEEAREQVDRILASDTFRTSEVLCRLLRFLADKTFCGEADHLKEYSVGLDALGKPPTYDPRQDSGVRLQASRLRLKLEKYYGNEGKDDPLTIEMPRGRFKIVWRPRGVDTIQTPLVSLSTVTPPLNIPADLDGNTSNVKKWRGLALSLASFCLVLVFISIWSLSTASRRAASNSSLHASSPDLETLWGPLLSSSHHLIIAFSNPLFVRLQKSGSPDIVYRRRGMTGWDEAVKSPEFSVLGHSLGDRTANPTFNFVERSNLVSIFVLSQFFAPRRGDISLARSNDLSWAQFAENDLVILASPASIDEKQAALPVKPAFMSSKDGVHNLQPLAGEPPVYADAEDHQESDGTGLELVSVLPGPLGRTTVVSFVGNHAWGVIACVQALTEPSFAKSVVEKLKSHSGGIPHYYQMVIRIGYRDGTATSVSYVTHRALALVQNSEDFQQ